MNYMDLLGGGFPPGFEGQMPQPQQMQQMQQRGCRAWVACLVAGALRLRQASCPA